MSDSTSPAGCARPLDGVRVVEVGQLLAGPFAGTFLGYFGAEVIKIEPPEGDPIRGWRSLDEGTSLWWRSLARNKKCVTLDLRRQPGRDACRALALRSDVLIENFRPGTMERWSLGPEDLAPTHPKLVYARVSGFGQTGPYHTRPGYAAVCEAIGGLRHVTGHPGQPPVRPNLSLGDSLAGLHAALGILLALRQRERSGRGQVVDVALFESVFNMLESVVPEFHRLGEVRAPSGTALTGVVPSNAYPCRDGQYVVIGANGDSVFQRLMHAADRPDLAERADLHGNPGRVRAQPEIDQAIAAWTATRSAADVARILEHAEVPVGPIYDAADMARDPHFRARGLFETVSCGARDLEVPAIRPRLQDTPGRTEWAGPELGAHQEEVLGGLLGMSSDERARAAGRGEPER